MSTTLNSSGVTFPDSTTQTTAATAPTTAQVLNATAGAGAGGVGTYAFLGDASDGNTAAGGTKAGSSLRYAGAVRSGNNTWNYLNNPAPGTLASGTPSGTWRCMGYNYTSSYDGYFGLTLWLRIS